MAPRKRILRQLEVGVGCLLGGIGLMMCMESHWAKDTHIGEFGTREPAHWVPDAPWWVIDSVWLFGLLVAAVVGFRGGFLGSQLTAILAFLALLPVLQSTSLPWFPLLFFPLGAFHLLAALFVGMRIYLRRGRTDEDVAEVLNANAN